MQEKTFRQGFQGRRALVHAGVDRRHAACCCAGRSWHHSHARVCLLCLGLPGADRGNLPQDEAIGCTRRRRRMCDRAVDRRDDISSLIVAPVALAGIGASSSSSSEPRFAPDGAIGKLEALRRGSRRAAPRSGAGTEDQRPRRPTQLGVGRLRTLLGGRKHIEPSHHRSVEAGWCRTSSPGWPARAATRTQRHSGHHGVQSEASYGGGAGRSATLGTPTRAARQDCWESWHQQLSRASAGTTGCSSSPARRRPAWCRDGMLNTSSTHE